MSSFWKMQYASTAMQVVVQEHAPAELRAQLERQMQENERLRMQVEDLRQAQISPYDETFSRSRKFTWREVGQIQIAQVVYLHEQVIGPAVNIMEEARRGIRMLEGTPAYTPDLVQAYNAMCDAEKRLRDEDDEEVEDSEEAEDSEEDEEGEMEEE